jgi:hypothetical protein
MITRNIIFYVNITEEKQIQKSKKKKFLKIDDIIILTIYNTLTKEELNSFEIVINEEKKSWIVLHLYREFNEDQWILHKCIKEESKFKIYPRLPVVKIHPKILILQLLRGINLLGQEVYASIYFNTENIKCQQKIKSKINKIKGFNPIWNQKFEFKLLDEKYDIILEFWEKTKFIGVLNIKLENILPEKKQILKLHSKNSINEPVKGIIVFFNKLINYYLLYYKI